MDTTALKERTSAGKGSSVEPGRQPRRPKRSRATWPLLAFALPSIGLVSVFFVAPFLLNSYFAFTRWTGMSEVISWSGLANFQVLRALDVLPHSVVVTVVYAGFAMLVQNVISLMLALALQNPSPVTTFFRVLFFIPVLISPVAAGYVWSALLAPQGPINGFLSALVPGEVDYALLGHSIPALLTVATIDAWKWSGLIILVYIAGLNAIPASILEAATVDGAGPWRRFWQIKWPLLAPAVTFNVVITLVGAFSAFDVILATTRGGPGDATMVLNVALYQQYGASNFGTASALSFVVTVMVIVTAVPLVTWLRRREVTP